MSGTKAQEYVEATINPAYSRCDHWRVLDGLLCSRRLRVSVVPRSAGSRQEISLPDDVIRVNRGSCRKDPVCPVLGDGGPRGLSLGRYPVYVSPVAKVPRDSTFDLSDETTLLG